MGSTPKVKPYQMSPEEKELQRNQLEEISRKDSELAEAKHRRNTGAKKRSLLSHVGKPTAKAKLGGE